MKSSPIFRSVTFASLFTSLYGTGLSGAWAQMPNVLADDESALGAVVVTASRREQAINEAPASISVITRREIEAKPYNSVADVVRSVEGVNVVGSNPNDQDISIRGMPGEYTLILVDGMRQNTRETMNRSTSGVQSNLLPPLSAIERIEVVRGPMSSLYGADAMGGVVNIITRKVPREWSGTVTAGGVWQQESDLGNTRSMDFWTSGPIKEDALGLQISGKALRRTEDDVYYPLNSTSGANGQRNRSLDVKLTIKPAENQDIALSAGHGQLSYLSTPGLSIADARPGSRDETVIETRHSRDYWNMTHNGQWGFGKSTLALYGEKGTQNQWTGSGQTSIEPVSRNTVLEGKLTLPWAQGKSMLTTGGQYIWSKLSGVSQQDAVPSGHAVNPNRVERDAWALFGENDYFVSDAFTLTTGLRLDHDENYGSHVSPRVYGVYNLDSHWTLRGGVSSGFKAPSLRQSTGGYCMTSGGAAGAVPGTLCGNPDLKPETSLTQEIGLRYDQGDNYVSTTLFHNLFRNKVASYDTGEQDPNSPSRNIYVYDNIDEVEFYGIELGAGANLTRQVRVSGAYTLLHSRREGSGESAFNGSSLDGYPLDKTPKHKVNMQLDWSPSAQSNLYANVTYTGKQYWAAFRNGAQGVRERSATTILDLGGRYVISKNIAFNIAVLNLTNRRVPVDDRARNDDLSGNWLVDEGRRLAANLTLQF